MKTTQKRLLLAGFVLLLGFAVFNVLDRLAQSEAPTVQSENAQQYEWEQESPATAEPVADAGSADDDRDKSAVADERPGLLLPSQVVGQVFPKVDLEVLASRLPLKQFVVFERARKEFPVVDWTEIEPTHQSFLDKRAAFPLNLNDEQREAYAAWLGEVEPMSRELIKLRAEEHGLSASGMEGDRGFYIDGFRNGEPVYVGTANVGAAITTGASYVRWNPGFDPALETGTTINGGELYVTVCDFGEIYEHNEFQLPDAGGSRIVFKETGSYDSHTTHVTGIMAAWGYESTVQGMAPRSWIRALIQMITADISNYGMATPGQLMGVDNPRTGMPQLRSVVGNTSLASMDVSTGYNGTSANYDTRMRDYPYYMHFTSAGNSGGLGYESLTGDWKISKNMMVIGNVSAATRDANGIFTGGATINPGSSLGPTYDGRIKPDFVAKGTAVKSTTSTNTFAEFTGTSQASPNAAGSVALLTDYVRLRLPQQYLRSSTYCALLTATSDDLGNPGPDYIYGWGILNIHAAATIVREQAENPLRRLIIEDSLAPSQTWTETYYADGTQPIRVSIAWLDAASSNLDENSRASRLVNDLDLRLTGPDDTEHMPYVMPFTTGQGETPAFDPSLYDAHAVPGDNTTDPVEQVYIAAPAAGTYIVQVTHKGSLTNNASQPFAVAVSGLSSLPQSMDVSRGGSSIAVGGVDGVSGTGIGAGSQITCTISNVGDGLLELTTPVTISGQNNCSVTVNTPPSDALVGGASTDLVLTVTPAATGTWSFGISITNNDPDKDPYHWTVTGVAGDGGGSTNFPLMVVTRDSVFVANDGTNVVSGVEAGVGAQFTYTIENLGDADLTLTTPVSVSGEVNCSINVDTQPSSPVAASGSTDLVLTVTPSGPGDWSATVSIANNDSDKDPYVWELGGIAIAYYTVTFDKQGGTGGTNSVGVTYGMPMPPATAPTREGYAFGGYFTETDGGGTQYYLADMSSARDWDVVGDSTLYAQWILLPPDAPTGLAGMPYADRMALSWSVAANTASSVVKRATSSGGSYTEIGTTTDTTYDDTGVTNGTTYYYVVAGANSAGESPDSEELEIRFPYELPFVEEFETLEVGDLHGQNGWVAAYATVQTNVVFAGSQAAEISTDEGSVEQSFVGSETNVWTDYRYRPVFADGEPIALDAGLTSVFYFNTNGHLVVYNGASPEVISNVTITAGEWVRVSVQSDYIARKWNLYVDAQLAAVDLDFYGATTERYTSLQIIGAGSSTAYLDAIQIGIESPLGDLFIPAPSGLSAMAIGSGQIDLSWTDNSTNETGFAIERSVSSGSGFLQIDAMGENATSYSDITVDPNATYYYRVVATNAVARSTPSGETFATTPKAPATVTLENLSQVYDGTARAVSYTTDPTDLTVIVTYDGSATAPTNAGSYAVTGVVSEINYQGSATATLVVDKAEPNVTNWPSASDIQQGQAVSNSVLIDGSATVPGSFTFDSPSDTPPQGTNTVNITFTPDDTANYVAVGGTTTLIVTKVKTPATVTLGSTNQVYNGSPRAVTVETAPTGLVVTVTYDGSGTAPTDAGNYAVIAIIDDVDYAGSTSGTLVISKATPSVTWPSASDITVGQAVSNSFLSSGSSTPSGSFSFDDPSVTPSEGTYGAAVTFTPDDLVNWTTASGSVDITVLPLPPSIPTGLSATPSIGQVDLSWSPASGATSYKVKRASVPGGPYSTVGTPATTNFSDSVANGATYYYVVSAVNAGGEGSDSDAASATLLHVLPFSENFEALNIADLNGQNGWNATSAVVQTNVANDARAASISTETGLMSQTFANSVTNVWTDFVLQPVFGTGDMTPSSSDATVFFYFNTNGNPVVYDGPALTTITNVSIVTGTWVRVTIKSDYAAKTWNLYIDSLPVATDLGFYSTSLTRYHKFTVSGARDTSATLDDLLIGPDSPFGELLSLTVISPHGTPSPAGTNWYVSGSTVTFEMTDSPFIIATNSKYEATGWIGTGSLTNGTGTNGSFTITNDTTLTWQWNTNYWVDLSTTGE